jgi:hypothetical protein
VSATDAASARRAVPRLPDHAKPTGLKQPARPNVETARVVSHNQRRLPHQRIVASETRPGIREIPNLTTRSGISSMTQPPRRATVDRDDNDQHSAPRRGRRRPPSRVQPRRADWAGSPHNRAGRSAADPHRRVACCAGSRRLRRRIRASTPTLSLFDARVLGVVSPLAGASADRAAGGAADGGNPWWSTVRPIACRSREAGRIRSLNLREGAVIRTVL